ncbi:DUF4350 domain-containing protein [Leptolyngbya sp. AN02str]|uniref:DUF4350 domain-containing protein n=1 Tax=Leptolyngbya sp. AN02str TaxID=3423363 RepID=UPI003D31130B
MTLTLSKRQIWMTAIALGTLVLLSAIAAPNASRSLRGSTYSRAPDGYGAWYAYMAEQGIEVQRWQRPESDLVESNSTQPDATEPNAIQPDATEPDSTEPEAIQPDTTEPDSTEPGASAAEPPSEPITLLQVYPDLVPASSYFENWIRRGNVLVAVGVRSPVTEAPFRSNLPSDVGSVSLATRRRFPTASAPNSPPNEAPIPEGQVVAVQDTGESRDRILLADEFGAVVAQRTLGQGQYVTVVTPHLAANAYQDAPGNFRFLADLVAEPGHPIYVDEYLHGYRDREAIESEARGSLLSYFAQTPVLLVLIQAGILVLLGMVGHRRLGPPRPAIAPPANNSDAYIQALGAVLHKAECNEFVQQTVGKATQAALQRSLGLGVDPVDPETLAAAWTQQTSQPADALTPLVQPIPHRSDRALAAWLAQIQSLRQFLP